MFSYLVILVNFTGNNGVITSFNEIHIMAQRRTQSAKLLVLIVTWPFLARAYWWPWVPFSFQNSPVDLDPNEYGRYGISEAK